jgi:cobyrinic acid a,c-diamide synthase
VAEHRTEVRLAVERIGAVIAASCDMGRIIDIARSASNTIVPELPAAAPSGSARIALASGPAFSFVYPENLELLEQAGGELVPFDPLRDRALPDGCQALYAGGGFPEEFGAALAENRPLLSSVRRAIEAKLTTWAECGGLLWLSRSLDGSEMVGAIPGDARMTEDLSIGYRTATTRVATPFGEPGSVLRGYEFHRTTLDPPGDALLLEARFGSEQAGYASPTLFASYLHQHLSASPGFAERFVAASSMKS